MSFTIENIIGIRRFLGCNTQLDGFTWDKYNCLMIRALNLSKKRNDEHKNKDLCSQVRTQRRNSIGTRLAKS